MRFITAGLIVFFVSVVSGVSTFAEEKSVTKIEETTEANFISSTTEKSITDDDKPKTTRSGKLRENDGNDLATNKDMPLDELFLIERIIDEEDKVIQEQNQKNSDPNNAENNNKDDGDDNNPENPIESKINQDFIDIQRQETNLKNKEENSSPAVQYDDSKSEIKSDVPQRFGQRSRKFRPKIQDSVPLLQLTQGGYERPYKRTRFRDRFSPRPDSSEQSENVQQLDRASNNKKPETRRIVPEVTYVPDSQLPYTFAQGPFMNSPFDASGRNMLAMNQILQPSAQNGFLNSPPADFVGYPTTSYQPQFAPSSDIGSVPNFSRDPNNAGMYQTLSNSPFQAPGIIFQNSPQIQPQPALIDTGRNAQTEFQQNPVPAYSGYENMQDSSTPNYVPFFRNPAMNTPFQVPPNFYGNAPNAINTFNSPSMNFLSQYPNFDNRVPSQLFQYPDSTSGTQNNQQSFNNRLYDPDASQNENKDKIIMQSADKPINREDPVPVQLGTSSQTENVANVYMRYPTAEAGYAIEENLPSQNSSDESKDDIKRSKDKQINNPTIDRYKSILNSVRSNQRINNSFNFPPELFRSVPIDFGYQSPQGDIFTQYPSRNRGIPNYPSHHFESRLPFAPVGSRPESFLGLNNQPPAIQESNKIPSCAKENNTSVCFEDSDYPKNDILYALSNSFLLDRLIGPEPSLDSFAFVERNGNETEQNEENYACDADTKYGMPLRAKNLDGMWKIIVNLQGRFSQPLRMEICKSLGSTCSYTDSRIKTACVQKFTLQRLLSWSPNRGIYSDVYKIPVACSCQIIEKDES